MVYSTNITAMHISEHFNHPSGGATIIKMNETGGGNIIDSWQHQGYNGSNNNNKAKNHKNPTSNSWSNDSSTTSTSQTSTNDNDDVDNAAYTEVIEHKFSIQLCEIVNDRPFLCCVCLFIRLICFFLPEHSLGSQSESIMDRTIWVNSNFGM
jgi:hypothetical protein